ncbi:hypothetical protein K439DRAFT_1633570 [Ramaria rubella]|nr:hypothetical protein K439DRAFT_1633570 [Ramaria rubella]
MGNRAHGAKNADGKDDGQHVNIYHSEDIKSHAKVNLSQGGLILIALLRGGDYDQKGIDGCGVNTAHALARAGFGDTLLKAARSSSSGTLSGFLPTWRKALQHELRTNASGFAQRKSPTLAQRITDDFPRLDVLRCYTHPITSEAEATGARGLDVLWQKRADVAKIAHVCEMYFEWGVEKTIIKRFRNFLWQGAMLRLLLQAALDRDGHGASTPSKSRSKGVETPSKALARSFGGMALGADSDEDDEPGYITAIHGERRHTSTGGTLEYRLEIDPRKFVARARSGIQGIRVELGDSAAAGDYGEDDDDDDEDEDGKKKKQGTKTQPADPDSKLRMWMPAVMVECAFPALVADFKDRKAVKEAKKGKRTQVKKPGWKVRQEEEEEEEERSTPVKPAKKSVKPAKSAKAKAPPSNSDEDSDGVPIAKPNSKFKGKAPMGSTLSKWPASKSKSIVQLLDEDPFSQPVESKHSSPSKPSWLPRPFPMARDNVFAESSQSATSSRTRKYLSTSASPPESKPIHAPLKKSPRKSTEHTWPRKPTRSPSPSPRRTFAAKMRPLAMATARTSAFKMDGDVIIISSDSDDPPPQSKKLNALTRKKILGSRKVSDIVDLS